MQVCGLVSIIIPSFGCGEYLIRTVESSLNQNHSQLEVIVVDDNGIGTENQKNTFKRLELLLDDTRLKYIAHETNKNGSAARNTGAKASNGEYLLFLDDDDIIKPNNIVSQVEILGSLDQSWAMSYCSSIEYMNGVFYKNSLAKKSGYMLYEILMHSIPAATSTLLIRRNAFEAINGFDETFWRHQDYEFVARMAERFQIAANPFVGLEKFWLKRTVANKQVYMDHYLKKIDDQIKTLDKKKQKEVIVTNQLSVALGMLTERQYYKFIKRFIEIKGGYVGVEYVVKMILDKMISKRVGLR